VYRALDTKLNRDVALKFVTHVGDHNPELNKRLLREARSLAALNHRNIVTIHDIDEIEEGPFLVLEWIDGRPLSDASFPLPLPVEDFQRIALPIAEALGAAHNQGIIHRDIKPSNVLISNDGQAKVVDFGLAKFRDAERDEILIHKWIESAKAGRDIGFEQALTDWIVRHRSKWRKMRQAQAGNH